MASSRFQSLGEIGMWRESIRKEETYLNAPPPYIPRVKTPVNKNSLLTEEIMRKLDQEAFGSGGGPVGLPLPPPPPALRAGLLSAEARKRTTNGAYGKYYAEENGMIPTLTSSVQRQRPSTGTKLDSSAVADDNLLKDVLVPPSTRAGSSRGSQQRGAAAAAAGGGGMFIRNSIPSNSVPRPPASVRSVVTTSTAVPGDTDTALEERLEMLERHISEERTGRAEVQARLDKLSKLMEQHLALRQEEAKRKAATAQQQGKGGINEDGRNGEKSKSSSKKVGKGIARASSSSNRSGLPPIAPKATNNAAATTTALGKLAVTGSKPAAN